MAKKSKVSKAAKGKKPAVPDYRFVTYSDNASGFAFALLRADGSMLMHSGSVPFRTRQAAVKAIEEIRQALQALDVPVMKETDAGTV